MKVIIFSQQRTGSNMLRTMLSQHPSLRVGGEAFIGTTRLLWSDWTDKPLPDTLINNTLFEKPTKHIKNMWEAFDIWNIHDPSNKHCGNIHDILLKEQNMKIIWLSRVDKISQAISKFLCHKTNYWTRYNGDNKIERNTFYINPHNVKQLAKAFNKQRESNLKRFENCGLPSISITYEDFCEQPDETLKKITDFLGIPFLAYKPKTTKTYKKPIHELISNYEEIQQYVRSSTARLTCIA